MKLVTLCMLANQEQVARIERASTWMRENRRGLLILHDCESWRHIDRQLTAIRPDILILDPCARADSMGYYDILPQVMRLALRSPVVAYPSGRDFPIDGWIKLARHGLMNVIEEPKDQIAGEVAELILDACGLAHAYATVGRLAGLGISRDWIDFLQKIFLDAHRALPDDGKLSLSVPRMAELWIRGSKPHHLQDSLRMDGLPPAGWIARWLIALRCVTLKPVLGTWESVAIRMGFESYRDLSKFIQRLTGHGPAKLSSEQLLTMFRGRTKRSVSSDPPVAT
ncbi:MAG TPA: hypothetical protein VK929_08560 [Longimicrobiales bacterium]|nr:hypothetical protein [Longimicrobiales bacterium]